MKRMFISDLHIGYHLSKYKLAIATINMENPDELYIIGDIIDLWRDNYYNIRNNFPDFFEWIRNLSTSKKVYWIIGNHDMMVPKYENTYTNINFSSTIDIELNNDKWVRIRHGHEYDGFIMNFYPLTVFLTWLQEYLYKHKDKDFSLSSKKHSWLYRYAVKKVKNMACRLNKDMDILIMGHTHIPEDTIIDGLRYMNTGDWVDSKSYIIEENGKLNLLRWD